MRTRLILTILTLCIALPVASHLFNNNNIDIVAAASPRLSAMERPALSVQATSIDEVEARSYKPLGETITTYQDDTFAYTISYPTEWAVIEAKPNEVEFLNPQRDAQITVTAVGPLASDGLTPFVLRSITNEVVLTRQSLTINGFPAERVVVYSDALGGQVVKFFVQTDSSAFIISGIGNRLTTEMMALSLSTN